MVKKVTDTEIIKVYEMQMGNLTETAKALNIGRRTLYDRMEKSQTLKKTMEDVDESNKDFGECQLRKLMTGFKEPDLLHAVKDGVIITKKIDKVYPPNCEAVKFFLKTKAQDRGYSEKIEHTHEIITVTVGGVKK